MSIEQRRWLTRRGWPRGDPAGSRMSRPVASARKGPRRRRSGTLRVPWSPSSWPLLPARRAGRGL